MNRINYECDHFCNVYLETGRSGTLIGFFQNIVHVAASNDESNGNDKGTHGGNNGNNVNGINSNALINTKTNKYNAECAIDDNEEDELWYFCYGSLSVHTCGHDISVLVCI